MKNKQKLKLAILDMYDNEPNEGMRCLKDIVNNDEFKLDWEVFDVRHKNEVPDTSFDIYISTGGPGSPYEGEGKEWEKKYFDLLDKLWAFNLNGHAKKKYFFAICFSFQLVSRHFQLGNVCKRKSTAFGVFPVHKTENASNDKFFRHLPEPYYAVDSRDWQLIEPDFTHLEKAKGVILSIEKKREHVPFERAVMALRLSDQFYMTQFHPEADAEGMLRYFALPEKKEVILKNHSLMKLEDMVHSLNDPNKIPLTQRALIPAFLRSSINLLQMN